MTNFKTEVSIIIPIYNRINLLLETLDSILEQKFNNYEVLIIDDGSDQNQLTLLLNYLDELNDSRFKYILKP